MDNFYAQLSADPFQEGDDDLPETTVRPAVERTEVRTANSTVVNDHWRATYSRPLAILAAKEADLHAHSAG